MPVFSLVTPVFNPPLWALEECISSVLSQTFIDWEWCIADDASTDLAIVKRLEELSRFDARVRLSTHLSNGGIVEASNCALSLATGEYIALLDHDDSLTADALDTVFELLSIDPTTDYVYSDEDKIDSSGRTFETFHKPSWAPERLLGQNYCCHLSVFRHSLVRDVGGFRSGFEGSQDYDLILRVTEKARRIHHIPRVLYHWRVVEGSTAAEQFAKPYAIENARRSVSDHLARRQIPAKVETTVHGYQRVLRQLDWNPLVTIVIPSGGFSRTVRGSERILVIDCVNSILELSTYRQFEIVIVLDDNDRCAADNFRANLNHPQVRLVDFSQEFDFSAKCNLGAAAAFGEVLLFLNDDTEIISHDWLETLLGHLADPNVGAVGPRLLFENGSIQSAGHTNDPSPHSFGVGLSRDFPGEFGNLAIAQERSGLTGACIAMRKELYFLVGGMSLRYPHCFNDVDLCCKIIDMGFRIIWTPFADLYHYESLSRDPTPRSAEIAAIYERWGRMFGNDRYLPQPEKKDWRD